MDEEKTPKVTIADLSSQNSASDKIPESQVESPAEPAAAPISPKTDYLFFNVMPKNGQGSSMTQPTLKVENSVGQEAASAGFVKKYKLYIIGGVIVLVLGCLIYFLAGKLGGDAYKSNVILATPSHTAGTTPSNSSTTAVSLAGFTTPQNWRDKYFPNCKDPNICGDNADPDQDGLTNLQEFQYKTDPNNPDSDKDGISDGDEINVFNSDPLNAHSSNDQQYNDGDYIKGGYDISSGKILTPQQTAAISAKMRNFGLHQPTITTLGDVLNTLYNFSTGPATTSPASIISTSTQTSIGTSTATSTLDQTLVAKQDRDTQRSTTIKNVEAGLIKYKSDNQTYPLTNDFATMFADIKPYLRVATNPVDPINKDPYIYSYASTPDGSDFALTFFSEVAGQPITKHSTDAIKDTANQEAAVFDDQRQTDLENIRTALLLYSQNNVAGNQTYVFPGADKYKTALVPTYIEQMPTDPKTGQDYTYQVSSTFNTFTLKAVLDNPPVGTTGYSCNQDECTNY